MRRIFTLLGIVLLFGTAQLQADALQNFKVAVLSSYNQFFTDATLSESGHLQIQATDSYFELSADRQTGIVTEISNAWHGSLEKERGNVKPFVEIQKDTKHSLWIWDENKKEAKRVEEWDNINPLGPPKLSSEKIGHGGTWFLFLGAQAQVVVDDTSSQGSSSSASLRVGSFLFKRQYDVSLGCELRSMSVMSMPSITAMFDTSADTSSSYSPSSDSTVTSFSTSIMMRKHFTYGKILRPNLGGQLALQMSPSFSFSPAVVAGIGFLVGQGTIDLSSTFGKNQGITFTLGYTGFL